jgi:hypothetical protein
MNGNKGNVYRLSVGKPEEKRPPGRPGYRWLDSSKMEIGEIGCSSMDWIDLVQYRDKWKVLMNAVMNLLVS